MKNLLRRMFNLSYKVKIGSVEFFVKYRSWWKKVNSGKWEEHTFEVFDRYLDKKSSFIDIGAWIGPTTLYASHLSQFCFSIEPDPVSYKELEENVSLNPGIKNKIKLYNFCIGDKCSKVKFGNKYKFGNSSSSILFGGLKDSIYVNSVTLQKFIQTEKIDNCNFIKMDIEGGEVIVLPAIKKYLEKNVPSLYISLHPHYFTSHEKDSKLVVDSLKMYKNLYVNGGQLLTTNDLFLNYLMKKIKCEILATNKDWV